MDFWPRCFGNFDHGPGWLIARFLVAKTNERCATTYPQMTPRYDNGAERQMIASRHFPSVSTGRGKMRTTGIARAGGFLVGIVSVATPACGRPVDGRTAEERSWLSPPDVKRPRGNTQVAKRRQAGRCRRGSKGSEGRRAFTITFQSVVNVVSNSPPGGTRKITAEAVSPSDSPLTV